MKNILKIGIITLSLVVVGCKTDQLSPLPKTTSAVLVGIGVGCDKKEIVKKGADIDVDSMYESIRFCYGESVHYIWDTGYNNILHREELIGPWCNIKVLENENACVGTVKNAIKAALNSELAIVYFSCKATLVPTTDADETDGLDEALQLYDGLLIDNDIWNILKTTTNKVFIVFDTSHSETMFKTSQSSSESNLLNELVKEIQLEEELRKIADSNPTNRLNMVCWAACKDDEKIDERSIGSRLTNAFYFKYFNKSDSYDRVFDRMYETTLNKQNINKTVIGQDFSSNSVFR